MLEPVRDGQLEGEDGLSLDPRPDSTLDLVLYLPAPSFLEYMVEPCEVFSGSTRPKLALDNGI